MAVFFFLNFNNRIKGFNMARVLQIRRGSAAQNDNFTGLVGEITFDTDAKTIRVHDGETLSGFPLARADESSSSGGSFDITSVPAETWQEIFANFAPTSLTAMESNLIPVVNTTVLDYIFDCDIPAKFVQTFLICQTPEAGYSINDEVAAFGIDDRNNPTPNTFIDNNGLHVRLMIDEKTFWVSHKNTGAKTNITNENWRLKFRIYY